MKNYKYLNAVGIVADAADAGGFDATQAAAMGLDVIVTTLFAVQDAKKNRELQEKLANLSLSQQKELNERLQNANTQLGRLDIMYKTFAVLENQKLINDRKNKQLQLLGVLGGGVLFLVGMSIFYKNKK